MSKTIYIDMDEVVADFSGSYQLRHGKKVYGPPEMYVPGFFLDLDPVRGSHKAIHQLIQEGHDVQILTQPVAMSPVSYIEKVQWIMKHFPILASKINMSQNKGNFVGAYLIDDSVKWKTPFEKNGGKFIHFQLDVDPEVMWDKIYQQIQLEDDLQLEEI
jgi:5'(3')-deoxyribonucleotidase